MSDLECIYDANALYNSYILAKRGTDFKESVQRYGINILQNIYKTQNNLKNGNYKCLPMNEFDICERGKTRHIMSNHISDRVVQRAFNDNVLLPKIRPLLIYDNGASLVNKGISFTRKRFEIHLRSAYEEYGKDAYILFMDLSKFFDNIMHYKALEFYSKYLTPDEFKLLEMYFKMYEVDVSYMSDEEYETCMSSIFNSVKYYNKIPNELKTGEKMMAKSIGLGSHTSQITGVYYAHEIDNFIKIVLGLKYYDKYMDDSAIIYNDKKYLLELLDILEQKYKEIGISINRKKTKISSIYEWNTFLKINYKVLDNGKIIRKVHSKTLTKERKRLRSFKVLLENNIMTIEDIIQCYKSWRGSYIIYDSGYDILKMDKYFNELFLEYL